MKTVAAVLLLIASPLLLHCGDAAAPSAPPSATPAAPRDVAELAADAQRFVGHVVTLEGVFQGFELSACRFAPAVRGAALSRRDWLFRTGAECVFVTGGRPTAFEDFDPSVVGGPLHGEPLDSWQGAVSVSGTLDASSAASCDVSSGCGILERSPLEYPHASRFCRSSLPRPASRSGDARCRRTSDYGFTRRGPRTVGGHPDAVAELLSPFFSADGGPIELHAAENRALELARTAPKS